jgi:thiamine kinase-like enzyme
MKTEIIFQDKPRIAQSENFFQDGKTALQTIVEAFAELGIGDLQDFAELEKLMHVNPVARQFGEALDVFISEKIAGQVNESDIPKVGFFRMKKQNIVNLLEKPDLSQFVEVYSENFQAASYAMELADLVKGKIILSKAKHNALVERHTVSAKTAEEKAILAKLHSIVETLKELHTTGLIVDSDLQRFKQIRVLANSVELQVAPAFFKQIQNRINN